MGMLPRNTGGSSFGVITRVPPSTVVTLSLSSVMFGILPSVCNTINALPDVLSRFAYASCS